MATLSAPALDSSTTNGESIVPAVVDDRQAVSSLNETLGTRRGRPQRSPQYDSELAVVLMIDGARFAEHMVLAGGRDRRHCLAHSPKFLLFLRQGAKVGS